MRIDLKAAAAALALVGMAFVTPANAQDRARAGTLRCEGGGQTSYVIGSVTEMSCVFVPDYGRPQSYRATIRRFGGDIGMTTRNALAWAVLAPTKQIGPGEIAGVYGGVAAAAAFGVGGAVNVLFGGSNNSFALQPISFQGTNGFNAAGGIASLELAAVRPMRSRHRRR
jgi:hypothetical protein